MALTDGLMAYWSMTETGTNSRQDASGNGRHFSTVGASVSDRAAIVPGFARSLDLPGDVTNGILSQADASWMTLNHDFTIVGWVLLDTNGTTELLHHYDGIRGYIAGSLENSTKLMWMYVRGTGFQNGFKRADTPSISTGTPYFLEFWHEAGVEFGLRINRGTAYTLSWANGVGDAAIILRFGSGDGAAPLDGAANGWGIWDRLLTSDERDDLYNSGDGLDYPFTVGGGAADLAFDAPLGVEAAFALTADTRMAFSAPLGVDASFSLAGSIWLGFGAPLGVAASFTLYAPSALMEFSAPLGLGATFSLAVTASLAFSAALGVDPQFVMTPPLTPIVVGAGIRPTYHFELMLTPTVWTDFSDRLISARHHRGGDLESGVLSGDLTVVLDNDDGAFDPANVASPYFGLFTRDVPMRLYATLDGTDYPLAYGYLDRAPTRRVGYRGSNVELTGSDAFKFLSLVRLGTDHPALPTVVFATDNTVTSQRVTELLDYAHWPVPKRNITAGFYAMPALEVHALPFLNAIDQCAKLERATVFLDGDNNFCFLTLFDRLTRASRGTFGSGGLPISDFAAGLDGTIYNRVEIAHPRQSDGVTVYEDGDSQALYGGGRPQIYQLDPSVGDCFQNPGQQEGWARGFLRQFAYPKRHIQSITLDPYAGEVYEPQLWWHVLNLEIGDRLTIAHPLPGVSITATDYHVQDLERSIVFEGDPIHTLTAGLSARENSTRG